MGNARKRHSDAFKAKVALEAVKEHKTLNELASEYGVHPVQIAKWKKEMLEGLPSTFSKSKQCTHCVQCSKERDELHRQLGEITVERNWLKKKFQSLT